MKWLIAKTNRQSRWGGERPQTCKLKITFSNVTFGRDLYEALITKAHRRRRPWGENIKLVN